MKRIDGEVVADQDRKMGISVDARYHVRRALMDQFRSHFSIPVVELTSFRMMSDTRIAYSATITNLQENDGKVSNKIMKVIGMAETYTKLAPGNDNKDVWVETYIRIFWDLG